MRAFNDVTGGYFGGQYYYYGLNGTDLFRLEYSSDCGEDVALSSDFEPTVRYGLEGEKIIGLAGFDQSGTSGFFRDTLMVSSAVAPEIDFIVDNSRCISNSNTFTPSNTGLSSYSWDFDGDGLEDSNLENPMFDYSLFGSGTYNVRLDVVDGVCTNFYEEEITIYEEPPAPTFTITTLSTFCTDNELVFTNTTDRSGYDSTLTFQWIIDGDEVNQLDTVYTFSSAGDKSVTLQSFIPGCASPVSPAQIVSIGEGPMVQFNYSNNCFSEPIQFNSEVSGNGISGYNWDFGDGIGTSTNENPLYTYSVAGDYTVTLSVSNLAGCETTVFQQLQVNDQPLATYSVFNAIENIPSTFVGEDLTLANDSIESWTWEIDGESLVGRQINYTFSSPGIYRVTLRASTYQGCQYQEEKNIEVIEAPFPTVAFLSENQLCINEPSPFQNLSVNADSFAWDFCLSEFGTVGEEKLLGGLALYGRARSVELVYDTLADSYFLFGPDEINNSLQRISLGDSLGLTYSQDQVSFVSGSLSLPIGVALERNSDGDWYGFLGSRTDGEGVSRINFGTSLGSDNLAIEKLGTFGEGSIDIVDVKVWREAGSYYLVMLVSDPEQFIIVNYGNSLANQPLDTLVTSTITGLNAAIGFDLVEFEGEKVALVGGLTSRNIVRVNFGSSIFQDIAVEASYEDEDYPSFGRMSSVKVVTNFGNYYAHVTSFDGGTTTVLLDLKNFNKDSVPADLGYSLRAFNDVTGGYFGGQYYYYGLNGTDLFRLEYSSDCGEDVALSSDFEPTVRYGLEGEKIIGLAGFDQSGTSGFFRNTLMVSSAVAPEIDFIVDNSRCISNSNTSLHLILVFLLIPGILMAMDWRTVIRRIRRLTILPLVLGPTPFAWRWWMARAPTSPSRPLPCILIRQHPWYYLR